MQERGAPPALTGSPRRHRDLLGRIAVVVAVAAVVVAADQASKSWAVHRLAHGPVHVIWKLDFALSYNTGSAFGLVKGWAPVLAALAVVVVVALLASVRGARTGVMALALGLVVGGAVGNLSDRVFRGHHGAVVDFVALHFWPTFNVADSCITVGVLLAALSLWRGADAPGRTTGAGDGGR